ncbi:MAG: SIMPL domain-containing protein [Candidatus Paceibacterota bacterium]
MTSTGSAKVRVMSDSAKFTGSVVRIASEYDLKGGYSSVASDVKVIEAFLKEKGLTEEEYSIQPVSVNEVYQYGENSQNLPKKYEFRQSIDINSKDIEKIESVANSISSLVNKNVLFQSYGIQYLYSGLAEKRVELLGGAIQDAKARASEVAKSSGGRIGKLQSSTSGVVQVLSPNSIDVSDYGSYDTSTKEKDISVTVRATFKLK